MNAISSANQTAARRPDRAIALPEEQQAFLDRIVAAATSYLGANVGFLAEFEGDQKVIRHTAGDADAAGVAAGTRFPLSETYCHRVALGELPSMIYDARADDRVNTLSITRQLDINAYIGVPVTFPDGSLFGTLCCVNFDADPADHERDLRFMHFLGDLVRSELGRGLQAQHAHQRRVEAFEALLREGGPRMVFQPIVSLESGAVVGAEALARFDSEPHRSPDQWFGEAAGLGLGVELELAAARAAIAQFPRLAGGAYLSVNLSPTALLAADFNALLDGIPPHRMVVEITEHEVIDEYGPLKRALEHARAAGIRIAIDDVGVGYAGLRHFLHIAPNIAKMDMSLTRDIDTDPVKRALATAIVSFAASTDLQVVAEGIETAAEAETLRGIGIGYGQGYFFGKPDTLPLPLPLPQA